VRVVYPAVAPRVSVSSLWHQLQSVTPYSATATPPRAFLAFGAPSFLKRLFWLLDHWQCVDLRMEEGAPVLPLEEARGQPNGLVQPGRGFPVLVFSHGNGASRVMYTGLMQELASYG
jgi:hypothetical protein